MNPGSQMLNNTLKSEIAAQHCHKGEKKTLEIDLWKILQTC